MRMTRKQFCSLAALASASAVQAPMSVLGAERLADAGGQAANAGKTPPKGITDRLVRFITTARLDAMPQDVVLQGKRCLIDGFGVILAGMVTPGSAVVREYVGTFSSKTEATLLGPGRAKAPVEFAALANGAFGHAMDFDDTQMSTTPDRTFGLLTHPTVPALASALAVAESLGATGARFLEAFLIGFEVECKIAEAINPDHYKRGFHSTLP